MRTETALDLFEVLDKIASLAHSSASQLSLDTPLESLLSSGDLVELVTYLSVLHGFDGDVILQSVSPGDTIEALYRQFKLRQDAAGIPDKTYYDTSVPASKVQEQISWYQKLISGHENSWHRRELLALHRWLLEQKAAELDAKKRAFSKEKRGCTTEMSVITLLLMIPVFLFLHGTAQLVILGLLAAHLFLTLVFRIWGLNSDSRKQQEKTLRAFQQELNALSGEIKAMEADITSD